MDNKQGGKRSNAGRKKLPQEERRRNLSVFPKEKDIQAVGGDQAAKEIALKAIEDRAKIANENSNERG